MNNFGQEFKEKFRTHSESMVHPHTSEEKANLFSSMDMGSTEVETINFINSIVYCFKPSLVLETGTYLGCGTIAIAQALCANGFGKVITMDINESYQKIAKANVELVGLSKYVEFIQSSSFEVIKNYNGPQFDFIFFDSDASRKEEFEMIVERKLFSENAICMFHDTSAKRYLSYKADQAYIEFLNGLLDKYEGFCFPFSRGFHFFRMGS